MCKECGVRFRSTRRTNHDELWDQYVFHKQTIRELEAETGHDRKTIHAYLHSHVIRDAVEHEPRPLHLVVDATYFGERTEGTAWGVILFRDPERKQNLWWKYIGNERASDYREGKEYLECLGYRILSVTGDGFLGLPGVFKGIPFQMCHFHMKQIVVRGVTRHPKTEPGRAILSLVQTITYADEESFKRWVLAFAYRYSAFMNEKTTHPDGSWSYTHEGVKAAYEALVRWFPYLFTYRKNRGTPNTTNTCDGHFSHIKDILRIHRGMTRGLKQKVIDSILLASTIAPKDR
jgi:hypothetical protein